MEWPVWAFLGLLIVAVVIALITRRPSVMSPPATLSLDAHAVSAVTAEEARLEYPGSTQLEGDHLDVHLSGLGDPSPEEVKNARFTEAPAEDVRTWYRNWLLGHGWTDDPKNKLMKTVMAEVARKLPPSMAGISMEQYVRARERFTLIVLPILAGGAPVPVELPSGTRSMYATRYAGRTR